MSTIDKQRIAAVQTLERFGFTFNGIDWVTSTSSLTHTSSLTTEADAMHALLMLRADKLEGCCEGSVEATELETITDTIEALRRG
jgi:hypothetical protein